MGISSAQTKHNSKDKGTYPRHKNMEWKKVIKV